MGRHALWSLIVFTVFTFAATIVFFWVREGSLEQAGAAVDRTLNRAGNEIEGATDKVVGSTDKAINDATDGNDAT